MAESARVGVIMGSDSDWSVMADAAEALAEFDIATEVRVVSAHRTPQVMFDYARGAPTAASRSSSPARAAPPTCPVWSPPPPRCR